MPLVGVDPLLSVERITPEMGMQDLIGNAVVIRHRPPELPPDAEHEDAACAALALPGEQERAAAGVRDVVWGALQGINALVARRPDAPLQAEQLERESLIVGEAHPALLAARREHGQEGRVDFALG